MCVCVFVFVSEAMWGPLCWSTVCAQFSIGSDYPITLVTLRDWQTIRITQFRTRTKDRMNSKISHFARSLDPSGWHSDQGSIFPGNHEDSRSRRKISEHSDRRLAQNFKGGTCCDSHLGWRYRISKNSPGGVDTYSKILTREIEGQGLKFIRSDDKGSRNHIR